MSADLAVEAVPATELAVQKHGLQMIEPLPSIPAAPPRRTRRSRGRADHDGQTADPSRKDKPEGDDGRERDDKKEQSGDDQDENGAGRNKDGKEDKGGKDGGEEKGEGKNDKGDDKDKKKSKLPIIILVVVGVLAVIGAIAYWYSQRNLESTDDAYTEGNAVAVAPKVSGYVVERLVDDNTFVKTGDLMMRIDPRDYVNARDQARANLNLARAQLRSAEIDLQIARVRYPSDKLQTEAQLVQAQANEHNAGREYARQSRVDQRATTQSTVDQAATQFASTHATTQQIAAQLRVSSLVGPNIAATSTALKQRQAQVEQAEASLAQAELNLSYADVRAPQEGYVTRRNVDVGTYAQPGQQVFYIVSPNTWVVANFKETQLNRMRPGQAVDIDVDAYPKLKLHGHVESIQQGSGARFTTFPQENATGNYVKIVRRVPVKITIDSGFDLGYGLPLGLSVEPTVKLK